MASGEHVVAGVKSGVRASIGKKVGDRKAGRRQHLEGVPPTACLQASLCVAT